MRVFMEFVDDEEKLAVKKLNEYIEKAQIETSGKAKIKIIGYQVNKERAYILAEEIID